MNQLCQCMLTKMCPSPVNERQSILLLLLLLPLMDLHSFPFGKGCAKTQSALCDVAKGTLPLKFGDSTKVLVPPSKFCDVPNTRKGNCRKLKWRTFLLETANRGLNLLFLEILGFLCLLYVWRLLYYSWNFNNMLIQYHVLYLFWTKCLSPSPMRSPL